MTDGACSSTVELDKKFYGVEFIQTDNAGFSLEEYLLAKSEVANKKYRFLIMVGEGDSYNGLPMRLRSITSQVNSFLEATTETEMDNIIQDSYYNSGLIFSE